MSEVTTIIPTTRGGLQHLITLLPGLAQEENNEIIVVDNASRDGTANYLGNYACVIKVNKENVGFAKANNQAALMSTTPYLLFLNNDTVIEKGLIKTMLDTFAIDEKIAVVGCLILRMDSGKSQHIGVCFTSDYVPYELGLELPGIAPGVPLSDPRTFSIREVPAVTAACMMVKRDVFLEVGGFDEGYINGWEDVDLILRIKEKGWKSWYNGKARIQHRHFGSKDQGRFTYEAQNRSRYDSIWVDTKRAENVLKGFREG